MNLRFFCAYHEEKMKACESEALRYWNYTMHRGMQAYANCRMEASDIYLGAALRIGIIRQTQNQNGIFEAIHILKPAEFLMEVYLIENRFGDAMAIISSISSAIQSKPYHLFRNTHSFLKTSYDRIAEKENGSLGAVSYGLSTSKVLDR